MDMLTRRILLTTTLAGAPLALGTFWPVVARAQAPEEAAAFIDKTGKELTGAAKS